MWSGPAYLWFCPLIPSHSLCSQLHWPSFRFLNSWTLISYSDVREKNQLWWGMCAVLCSVAQSCLTPGGPLDCSLPSPSVYGILQASILEWVAISFSRGSSGPRDETWVSCTAGWVYILSHQGRPINMNLRWPAHQVHSLILKIMSCQLYFDKNK